MPLQTRNVFVDTEFFVKAGLDFSSKTLDSFREICGKSELNHLTTTIVVREVKRKIGEHIGEALNGVNSFRRKAKILTNSSDQVVKNLFATFDQDEIIKHAVQVFDDFIDDSNTAVLDLKSVDSNEIVDMYFDQIAPFQGGKKKNEFPDAFTLLALRSALRDQDQIYVVSEDKDLVAFCEKNPRFLQIESLSKLLDLYNAHDEERSQFIKYYIEEKIPEIKKDIKVQIEDSDAYNSSSWEDAEVDRFVIRKISDFEPSIIHIDDESCQIVFDIDVSYRVWVTGPDFINGLYDRESGNTYTSGTTTREEDGEFEFTTEISLSYELNDGKFSIVDMEVLVQGLHSGLEFSVEENPYEDYR